MPNNILNPKNTEYQFAKNAFSVFQKLLVDNKNEFDSMIETVDSLNSAVPHSSKVGNDRNEVKDFVDNYLYKMTEDEFYKDFVVHHYYLIKVIDDNNCIVMDYSEVPCSYTEFGERMFVTCYLGALLGAQAVIFGGKLATKYSSDVIYCVTTISCALWSITVDISPRDRVGKHEIASCTISVYAADIRNTSLADLKSRKVTASVSYGIHASSRSSGIMDTTCDNIVPALKDFMDKLYYCL